MNVEELAQRDRFAMESGITLVEGRPGYAKAEMRVKPEHMNAHGVVQGGAIFTLADLAFAVAVNAHGPVAVAVNVNISFVKAAREGVLTAEAREVALSRRLGTYEVEVRDEQKALIAVFHGMAYRKTGGGPRG